MEVYFPSLMAYDIMLKLGERDPITLAAMLLHDTLEDGVYAGQPEALSEALGEALAQEAVHEAHRAQIRIELLGLVQEVTNPTVWPRAKEIDQSEHAAQLSFRAKKVKIIDQASSLACNLTMENDPKDFSPERAERFMEKTRSLVTAISRSFDIARDDTPEVQARKKREKREIKPFTNFFGHTIGPTRRLLDEPDMQAREAIRDQFNLDAVAKAPKAPKALVPPTSRVHHQLFFTTIEHQARWKKYGSGITRVDYDEQGKVSGCVVWLGPEENHKRAGERAEAFSSVIRHVRKQHTPQQLNFDRPDPDRGNLLARNAEPVTTDDGQTLGDGWLFELSPPMNAFAFAHAITRSKMGSLTDAEAVRGHSAKLEEALRRAKAEDEGTGSGAQRFVMRNGGQIYDGR